MIVLDTNVVSALMRAEADAATRAWLDRQAADSVWTTAVSVFELRAGIESLPAGRRRERLDRTLAAVLAEDLAGRVLPFDQASAEEAAVVLARRRRQGRPVEFRDTQIAGIVIAHRARLATFNARRFADLNVEVIDPQHH
jgi:hypothetical protein